MRAHSFLKGEDSLVVAAVTTDALAVTPGGRTVELPEVTDKRDGSGQAISQNVGKIGNALRR